MNCKFCNAELEEEVTLCPQCGKENAEELAEDVSVESTEETTVEPPVETPKKKRNLLVTILAVIGGVALLAVLAGAIFFGFVKDNVAVKTESYTVSVAKAEKSRDVVVATVGDRELTNSELQIYYWQGISDFYNYYGYYMDLSTLGLDLTQPLDQQFYDEANGVTWQQYFLGAALDVFHRYAALGITGESEGYTLDAEQEAYLDSIPEQLEAMAVSNGYKDAADMLYKDMGPACDVEGYMDFIRLNFYVGQYYDSVYAKLTPTMEEMEAYYAENEESLNAKGIVKDDTKYVDVRHILIKPVDGDLEACREKAQQLLDQWKAGEATEESFAQLAAQYTEDAGSQSTGGLYTDVYQGKMIAPFDEWCFDESRVYGDTDLVLTDYGYHIMFFVESRAAWVSSLETQMLTERSTALVEQAIANNPITVDMDKVVLCDAPEAEA